jgi:hypothetical protein
MPKLQAGFLTGSSLGGSCFWGGITKANFTHVVPVTVSADLFVYFAISGSAQTPTLVAFGDVPSGGTVSLNGSVTYITKD